MRRRHNLREKDGAYQHTFLADITLHPVALMPIESLDRPHGAPVQGNEEVQSIKS
jgi:hypothetical protein